MPTLISGFPFIPDGLIHIRDAVFIQQTNHLPSSAITPEDWRWPVVIVIISTVSTVTGLPALEIARFSIPLLASLSILIIYQLMYRLTRNSLLGNIAALLYATNGPLMLIEAGVTKQTIAVPISLILLFCYFIGRRKSDSIQWRYIVLIWMSWVTLLLSHHITLLFCMISLVTITALLNIFDLLQEDFKVSTIIFDLSTTGGIIGATFIGILSTDAFGVFYGRLDPINLIIHTGGYLLIFLCASIVLLYQKRLQKSIILLILGLGIFLGVSLILIPVVSVIPLLNIPYSDILSWIGPLLVIYLGLVGYLLQNKTDLSLESKGIFAGLLISSSALTIYSFLGGQNALFYVLILRSFNFVSLSAIPLTAIAIYLLILYIPQRFPKKTVFFSRALIILGISLVICVGNLAFPLTKLIDPTLSGTPGQVVIRGNDAAPYYWLETYMDHTLIGSDTETRYLIRGIANLSCDIDSTFHYIFNGTPPTFDYLLISNRMWLHGFQLPTIGYQWIPLPHNLYSQLVTSPRIGLQYSDGSTMLFALSV